MKAISIWQPWASCVANGMKRFETRSWSTQHRGLLAIHASITPKGWEAAPQELLEAMARRAYPWPPAYAAQREPPSTPRPSDYAHGAVVAIVRLLDCVEMTEQLIERTPEAERIAGDWTPGRFAWELELVTTIQPPIPLKGRQQLFDAVLGLEVLRVLQEQHRRRSPTQ